MRQLPIYQFVNQTKGFGELSAAKVIGSASDIGQYRNPACLWKRMGLAVIDGGRQRKVADKEMAILHGYSPQRRSLMYVIGESLMKAKGPYKDIYDQRKAYVATRDDNPITSPIHAQKDAMRYMTKRLLKDMWTEWRRT